MKKALLTGSIVFLFLLYSVYQHRNPTTLSDSTPTVIPDQPNNNPLSPNNISTSPTGLYKDGSYTGPAVDAFYGYVQVKATVSGGKIATVEFLQYPKDRRTSIEVNSQAMPILQQEAISAQSGSVNIITGATDTSMAFIQSLTSALNQAKN